MVLASGQTVTATAEAVGVTRQTVSEWLNQDADFQASLNALRAEALEAGADRLRNLVCVALDAVEAGLKADDLTTKEKASLGMDLLKQVGLTGMAGRPGETDPAEIREAQARKEIFRLCS